VPPRRTLSFQPDPALVAALNGAAPADARFEDELDRYIHAVYGAVVDAPAEDRVSIIRHPALERFAGGLRQALTAGDAVELPSFGRFSVCMRDEGRRPRFSPEGEPDDDDD
jgi:hypothetical protein